LHAYVKLAAFIIVSVAVYNYLTGQGLGQAYAYLPIVFYYQHSCLPSLSLRQGGRVFHLSFPLIKYSAKIGLQFDLGEIVKLCV